MAFGFLFFFVLGPLLLLTFLLALATTVLDASPWVWLVLALPVIFFLIVSIAGRFVFRAWRPVRDLVRAAGSLADGDYSVRVDSSAGAVRPVVTSFNQMADRLESADEQRRQLLADLGHELRTPLTVVRGEIEAMLDGVHEYDPAHLELLLDEVTVMERLIEDLRTLSLAEAGALALHPEATDLFDLVSDVADSYRRSAGDQGVVVSVDGSQLLEDVVVDPVRIREVVTNLVVNALKAMPDGGALSLRVQASGASAVIEVKDTGVGLTEDESATVFERFRKGSSSTGSGLGLTISRDLVEAHGGVIEMESTLGVGTLVRVRLPK